MANDPQTAAHLEWIGFVQPVGLVVSIPALLNAQAFINKNIAPVHQKFLSCLERNADDEPIAKIRDFRQFACTVLDWQESDLVEVDSAAKFACLEVVLPEYQERLRPRFAVPELKPKEGQSEWQLLVQILEHDTAFDESSKSESKHGWHASPQAKFERLLRESEVGTGLLVSSKEIRLVYAPRGESSGYVTFSVSDMISVAGRPILAAMHMLLSADRLFLLQQESQRLPAILADSRKYQNTVSNKLAEQVLAALFELLRGFQTANDQTRGVLLKNVLKEDPNQVYAGLLSVLMRLVFILYAEDRNLLSNSSVYNEYYSVSRLYQHLREDAGRYPDTMDHRYGSWAQLLTLFRLIFEGGSHSDLQIPERKGHLFDPKNYPFLEGRVGINEECIIVPQVSDGIIFRVLSNLLVLQGERISYRTLDVEQIGSVYEAIMGFSLQVASGTSVAIKPKKQHGAPVTINLEQVLALKPGDRCKHFSELTDQDLSGSAADALKNGNSIDDLLAALEKKIAKDVTPYPVPKGHMVLQPSSERRRSGSHYTPRSLTEPIVQIALRPILEQLGPTPTAERILDVKICDPAMGSGAFLVEACRQLGEELVKAWTVHMTTPVLPPDEDEVLHARRLVAQRCIYGVDKNPMAVNLAKLSLWLATLAKDHPFTFLDHTLRCGDSLVGLSKDQIIRFHWSPSAQRTIDEKRIKRSLKAASEFRKDILMNAENSIYLFLRTKLADADKALDPIRLLASSVIASFFSADQDRARDQVRFNLQPAISAVLEESIKPQIILDQVATLQSGLFPIEPFHWEIEFPEVFDRENGGFDVIVGNPPFAGKNTLLDSNHKGYLDWLKVVHDESHGNSDLVAHFFRRAFKLLRKDGCFGLIATNTIGQGDTRSTGLRWICKNGGTIFAARKRHKWPGQAAVVVSIVWVAKGPFSAMRLLDGRPVGLITAYLFHAGNDDDPKVLISNDGKAFKGVDIYGMGFTFDDTDKKGVATSIQEMERLIKQDPRNKELIAPYIGGEEVNDSPQHKPHRYAINFGEMNEEQARRWPDLMSIVEKRVKPERMRTKDTQDGKKLKMYWWQYSRRRPELYQAIEQLDRVLVNSQTSGYLSYAFIPSGWIYSQKLVIYSLDSFAAFCALQSRIHEVWARFFGSSMKDDLCYTPSDCFETFPFPPKFEFDQDLERAGKAYYDARAGEMLKRNEGLTKIYNRFHDPQDQSPEIKKLRELHDQMDRVVLSAYGWSDLEPNCIFGLDYEETDEQDDMFHASGRGRRKPWRYRWSDAFRDEILARLLELNKERAIDERVEGTAHSKKKTVKKKSTTKSKKTIAIPAVTSTGEEQNKQLTLAEIDP